MAQEIDVTDVYQIYLMTINHKKLTKRLLVVIFLVPILIIFIDLGGITFALFWTLILIISAWEYWLLFRKGEFAPSLLVLLLGVAGISVGRYLFEPKTLGLILSFTILSTLTVYIFACNKGSKTSGVDFGITLGGVLYLGWIGSYLISLRMVDNGKWWVLIVLPAVWFTDIGGYFIGSWFGKTKLSKIISPKKTVEGYFGGIIFSVVFTYLLSMLWNIGNANLNSVHALILGLVIGAIAPLGDLGESMLKRQFDVKDSSNLLPGHGGVFDRIDTWIWAGVLGYYLIVFFF